MELNGAKILYTIHTNIPLLGDFKITQTLVSTWIVMALLSGLAIWLGHGLKLENVSKRQAAAEFIVTRLDQFVHDNMGFHFDQYIPLIGSIFALSIGCNLISVVGLWSPTADLNTEAAWAIVVFVLIMYYKIKTNGILSYLKGLLDPIFIMAPINVLSEVSTPVSMAFRHFDRHPGLYGPVFRLVRRLHPGVHFLYPDRNLHQTCCRRRVTLPASPQHNIFLLGGQIL